MRGSLKIFTWFNIPVHLHWSFGLILLLPFWESYANNLNALDTIWLVVRYLAIFACVLLHEYGHALTARRYGIQTQDIILMPLGGVARLERMPEKPVQELLVAIAGPLVNVALAIGFFFLGKLLFQGESWTIMSLITESSQASGQAGNGAAGILNEVANPAQGLVFLQWMILINVGLVVFNLIPAFPMDGGRVFRALLAMQLSRVRATQIAAWLGQGIAALFFIVGIWFGEFILALIGLFVFTMARTENRMVRLDALLRGYTATDLMRPQFARLASNDWMQTPITLLQQGLERHFLVFDLEERLVGTLEEPQIITALNKRDLSTEIGKYMRPQVKVVQQEDSLEHIYHHLQTGLGILAVANQGEIVGVIDQAGLHNFLRMRAR